MFENIDWHAFAIRMAALVICFTIHEFAHAYSAYRAGDDTAKLAGRISLNPIDHLDPVGSIMMVLSSLVGYGIGWGKPVPVNPYRLRRPRWDNLMVSLWGPLSNLLTAAVVGLVLRFTWHAIYGSPSALATNVGMLLESIVLVSIGLAVFNLLPIPPLDGSHILSALLPYEHARRYDMMAGQFGMILLLVLVMMPGHILGSILQPVRIALWTLFTGIPY
jgi:Zn-dependent protease